VKNAERLCLLIVLGIGGCTSGTETLPESTTTFPGGWAYSAVDMYATGGSSARVWIATGSKQVAGGEEDGVVIKLLLGGTVDTTFGSSGFLWIDMGDTDRLVAISQQCAIGRVQDSPGGTWDNLVACWGNNHNGKCDPPPRIFLSLTSSKYHNCAVKAKATLACWGENAFNRATAVDGVFTSVSAGRFHTCGIRSYGDLLCWGRNSWGLLTPPAGTFSAQGAGASNNCAIKTDDTILCWGNNATGQSTPPPGFG